MSNERMMNDARKSEPRTVPQARTNFNAKPLGRQARKKNCGLARPYFSLSLLAPLLLRVFALLCSPPGKDW
jgi:hypothetical protein